MRVRWAGMATAVAVVLVAGAVAPAGGVIDGTLLKVSGRSPYANCTIGGSAVNYTQADANARVAAEWDATNNLVGVWEQDPWATGGARGLMSAWSDDGGQTWHGSRLPLSGCGPGSISSPRAADPWVSIGTDGVVYVASTGVFGTGSRIQATVSTDAGQTWQSEQIVKNEAANSQVYNDKPVISADLVTNGTAYLVWSRVQFLSGGRLKAPAYFAKTDDFGATWSTPKPIAANGINQATFGNNLVIDPDDGALFNFYGWLDVDTGKREIRYVKSNNGGDTWSRPRFVNRLLSAGVTHPVTGEAVRSAEFFPDVTINGIGGDIFVVWQDARNTGGRRDEILLSRSEDGGLTWTRVVRISSRVKRPAFTPTVAINASGVIGVSYFDFRNMTPGDRANLETDYWLRTSNDNGDTWGRDLHVAENFNLRAAPKVNGEFSIGDYMGLTAVGNDFIPFFVRTQCSTGGCRGNRTDVLSSTITP